MKKNFIFFIGLLASQQFYANPTALDSQRLHDITVQNFFDDAKFLITLYGLKKEEQISFPKAHGTDAAACTSITFKNLPDGIYHIHFKKEHDYEMLAKAISYIAITRSPRTFVSSENPTAPGMDEFWLNKSIINGKDVLIKLTPIELRKIMVDYIDELKLLTVPSAPQPVSESTTSGNKRSSDPLKELPSLASTDILEKCESAFGQ